MGESLVCCNTLNLWVLFEHHGPSISIQVLDLVCWLVGGGGACFNPLMFVCLYCIVLYCNICIVLLLLNRSEV